jgi:hypothetical protein
MAKKSMGKGMGNRTLVNYHQNLRLESRRNIWKIQKAKPREMVPLMPQEERLSK